MAEQLFLFKKWAVFFGCFIHPDKLIIIDRNIRFYEVKYGGKRIQKLTLGRRCRCDRALFLFLPRLFYRLRFPFQFVFNRCWSFARSPRTRIIQVRCPFHSSFHLRFIFRLLSSRVEFINSFKRVFILQSNLCRAFVVALILEYKQENF